MPLKTLVKVGNITNLSDARYCAGMGVDFLGFNVSEGSANYVSPQLFQEICGWVSVPSIVAEISDSSNVALSGVVENYAPHYIECDYNDYQALKAQTAVPFIVHLNESQAEHLLQNHPQVSYWVVDENMISQVPGNITTQGVLAQINSTSSIDKILACASIKGVVLNGSRELRPGFKDYDHIADILEVLEV
jgi:phosphoribosylanthranilate isomerase